MSFPVPPCSDCSNQSLWIKFVKDMEKITLNKEFREVLIRCVLKNLHCTGCSEVIKNVNDYNDLFLSYLLYPDCRDCILQSCKPKNLHDIQTFGILLRMLIDSPLWKTNQYNPKKSRDLLYDILKIYCPSSTLPPRSELDKLDPRSIIDELYQYLRVYVNRHHVLRPTDPSRPTFWDKHGLTITIFGSVAILVGVVVYLIKRNPKSQLSRLVYSRKLSSRK